MLQMSQSLSKAAQVNPTLPEGITLLLDDAQTKKSTTPMITHTQTHAHTHTHTYTHKTNTYQYTTRFSLVSFFGAFARRWTGSDNVKTLIGLDVSLCVSFCPTTAGGVDIFSSPESVFG